MYIPFKVLQKKKVRKGQWHYVWGNVVGSVGEGQTRSSRLPWLQHTVGKDLGAAIAIIIIHPPKIIIIIVVIIIISISIGNHMSVSAINDLHHEWCLKIVPKLHEPLGE